MTIDLRGQALIDDISNTQLAHDQLALWWLGQHSFVVKCATQILYLDPFLTVMDGRLVPPLVCPEQVKHADLIFGSHDHADHIDRPVWPALAHASPKACFVVPELLRESLITDLNITADRFIGMDDQETLTHSGVRITAIAAAHEFFDRDQATGRYPYLGFVIETDHHCIFHSGDTCIYEGLVTKLKRWRIDLMMLPINGRDARRLRKNIVGNMTYQEAVDLAGTLQTRYVIPTHYDMFAENPGAPQAFVDYLAIKYPKVIPLIPDYGHRVVLTCE